MFKKMRADIRSIRERDPAARSGFEIFWTYSGFHAVLYHGVSSWFYRRKLRFIARWVSQLGRFFTGIEIHPAAKIGRGLFIDHGMGVVIGETAEVGDNVTIYQGVTLGGTGKDTGKRHPTIGNDVLIGAGAKILGPFKVGDGAKIAANAVLLKEIPDGATAVGIPARVISINGERVASAESGAPAAADHPEIAVLFARIEALEQELEQMKEERPIA